MSSVQQTLLVRQSVSISPQIQSTSASTTFKRVYPELIGDRRVPAYIYGELKADESADCKRFI